MTPPVVSPSEVVPPAEPEPVVEELQTLPVTGSSSGVLAGLGAIALTAGLGIVLTGRKDELTA